MALREGLSRVLDEYLTVSQRDDFKKNSLADFLRNALSATIFKKILA